MQTLIAEERKELRQAADWCCTQCIPLQTNLKSMQGEATKAVRLLPLVARQEKEEVEMTEARQRWYDGQYYAAKTKLKKNSRYQQLQPEVKIAIALL